MFFLVNMTRIIRLEPRYLDANLLATVLAKLNAQVEGTCSGEYGYVICVTAVNHVDKPVVHDDGTVSFKVQFQAIVCRPFRGEVVDAVVTQVNKLGIFAEFGPVNAFVSRHQMSSDMDFDEQSIPQKYVSREHKLAIKKGDELRMRIIGMSVNAQQLCVVGSIKEDFMGPLQGAA
eukprot:EG_transcript_24901